MRDIFDPAALEALYVRWSNAVRLQLLNRPRHLGPNDRLEPARQLYLGFTGRRHVDSAPITCLFASDPPKKPNGDDRGPIAQRYARDLAAWRTQQPFRVIKALAAIYEASVLCEEALGGAESRAQSPTSPRGPSPSLPVSRAGSPTHVRRVGTLIPISDPHGPLQANKLLKQRPRAPTWLRDARSATEESLDALAALLGSLAHDPMEAHELEGLCTFPFGVSGQAGLSGYARQARELREELTAEWEKENARPDRAPEHRRRLSEEERGRAYELFREVAVVFHRPALERLYLSWANGLREDLLENESNKKLDTARTNYLNCTGQSEVNQHPITGIESSPPREPRGLEHMPENVRASFLARYHAELGAYMERRPFALLRRVAAIHQARVEFRRASSKRRGSLKRITSGLSMMGLTKSPTKGRKKGAEEASVGVWEGEEHPRMSARRARMYQL